MTEQLVGVIDNVQHLGIIPSLSFWSLFLTDKRLIAAKMLSGVEVGANNLKETKISRNPTTWWRIPGLRFGVMGYAWQGIRNTRKEVLEKSNSVRDDDFEQLLHSDKNNLSIPNDEIIKIEFRRGSAFNGSSLSVITKNKTYKFVFQPRGTLKNMLPDEDFEKYSDMIRSALPGKLEIK